MLLKTGQKVKIIKNAYNSKYDDSTIGHIAEIAGLHGRTLDEVSIFIPDLKVYAWAKREELQPLGDLQTQID